MDGLTKHVQYDISWCMLFFSDIVLIDETKNGVNNILQNCREALEVKGFKISRCKIEYMLCGISGKRSNNWEKLRLDRQKYHKSNGEVGEDINRWIKSGCVKRKRASECYVIDVYPYSYKEKFYRTTVRSALLYGIEHWYTKKEHATR